jgi:hypothetical protein
MQDYRGPIYNYLGVALMKLRDELLCDLPTNVASEMDAVLNLPEIMQVGQAPFPLELLQLCASFIPAVELANWNDEARKIMFQNPPQRLPFFCPAKLEHTNLFLHALKHSDYPHHLFAKVHPDHREDLFRRRRDDLARVMKFPKTWLPLYNVSVTWAAFCQSMLQEIECGKRSQSLFKLFFYLTHHQEYDVFRKQQEEKEKAEEEELERQAVLRNAAEAEKRKKEQLKTAALKQKELEKQWQSATMNGVGGHKKSKKSPKK